ncbi:MAG: amidohydrolase [Chloroflexi bacterium]|nr:amidohydrolase [Chloroflexota bacterium]MBI4507366.1 amidohydrolase [Chloroflexota bacterium]
MIIDFRLRPPYGGFVNLDVPYGRAGQWLPARLGVPFPPGAAQRSMELTLREMDEAGVTVGVVTGRAVAPGVSNDEIAELCRLYPGRFVGIASVDLSKRAEAVREFRRAVEELGLRGLILEPGMGMGPQPVDVDHGSLYGLYEEAQRLGVPVLFTLSLFVGPDIGYCLRNLVALDRLAGDFRRVSFVVAHAGWPYVEAALGLALKRPNVYLSPDLYGFDMPYADALFEAACGYLQDQYLFASAYPLYPLKPAVEKTAAGLRSDAVREKALHANAARLLRLEG